MTRLANEDVTALKISDLVVVQRQTHVAIKNKTS